MIRRFWLKLFRRRNLHRDLETELAFHREMAQSAGNPIPFGNSPSIQEQALDLWRFAWIENLWRDLRFASRGLIRSPILLVGALASLGLGIGANTALFSLGIEFLFSEPSVTDARSLVGVQLGGNSHAGYPVIDFIRDSGLFADVTGEQVEAYANWNDGRETRRLYSVVTAKNYFTALGVPMALGRGYGDQDPDEVVVLQHRFWLRYLNGDPSIIGRTLNLEAKPYTVVGVLPESHHSLTGFGFSPDVYIPRYLKTVRLAIYARLKPDQSRGAALAAVQTLGKRLDAVQPEPYFKYAQNCRVDPISGVARSTTFMTVTAFFAALLGIAGLVLLIACVNVASLLLARAAARRREIAIRVSLGAGRKRLLQQLLVESLLLAVLGTAFGLGFARVTTALLASIPLPFPVPIRLVVEPDWRLALYAVFLAAVATLACGLAPALASVRDSITPGLQREPRQRLRRTLVAAQIAVSLAVLVAGFLFLRNMLIAGAISPGFDVRNTVRAAVNLPPEAYGEEGRVEAYIDQALRALDAVPGIEAAAAARTVPFTEAGTRRGDLKFPDTPESVRIQAYWNTVTPLYFRVMGIPLLAGRTFLPADRDEQKAIIVNREFVRRYLGKRSPVGTTFFWVGGEKTPYRIVGVVEGTKNLYLGVEDEPQFYEPLIHPGTRIELIVRSALPPVTQVEPVRLALRQVEPAAAAEVQTLFSAIGFAFLPSQVGAALMGAMGILGLLLAAVGLYGTLIYSVSRRENEIAVRMAIGASRRDIAGMVLADSFKLIAIGSAIGLVAAFFITKPLAMFLMPGVKPADPLSFAAVTVVFVLTGIAAALDPARRAASIDPATTVRVS